MKHYLSVFLIALLAFPIGPAIAALSEADKALIGYQNTITNPNGESATAGYVASGGTFTTAGASGKKYFSWDSNSAGQTVASGYQTISSGPPADPWSSRNGEIAADFQCASGSCTHELQVYDGSNVIARKTITSSTSAFVRTSLNFIYPASGTVRWQLASVASNEPTVYFRNVYRGLATNLSQVSSATVVGTIRIACSGGNPTRTSTSFGDYTPGTTCTYTTTGAFSAPSTNIPGGRITSGLGPGFYEMEAYGGFGKSGSGDGAIYHHFSIDGTNPFSTTGTNYQYVSGSSVSSTVPVLKGHAELSSSTGDITLRIITRADAANVNSSVVLSAAPLTIVLKRFPTSSETGYRPDQALYSIGASGTATGGAGAAAVIVFPTLDYNYGGGYSISTGQYTAPGTGLYRVCARLNGSNSVNIVAYVNAVAGPTMFTTASGIGNGCANVFAVQGQTIDVRTASSIGAWGSGNYLYIDRISANSSAPLIVNSVTSSSSGSERVEHASTRTKCTSTPCALAAGSTPGISSISRSATGSYAINFVAGTFSVAPDCTVTTYNQGSANGSCAQEGAGSTSSQGASCRVYATGVTQDDAFSVTCIGPRQ